MVAANHGVHAPTPEVSCLAGIERDCRGAAVKDPVRTTTEYRKDIPERESRRDERAVDDQGVEVWD